MPPADDHPGSRRGGGDDLQVGGRPSFHIHETGECEAPTFESAGGHYNPIDKQHGWGNPEGHHAGDFANVHVHDDGMLDTSPTP